MNFLTPNDIVQMDSYLYCIQGPPQRGKTSAVMAAVLSRLEDAANDSCVVLVSIYPEGQVIQHLHLVHLANEVGSYERAIELGAEYGKRLFESRFRGTKLTIKTLQHSPDSNITGKELLSFLLVIDNPSLIVIDDFSFVRDVEGNLTSLAMDFSTNIQVPTIIVKQERVGHRLDGKSFTRAPGSTFGVPLDFGQVDMGPPY